MKPRPASAGRPACVRRACDRELVEDWELIGLGWRVWLLVALLLLLAVDLSMTFRGLGIVQSRSAALRLLALLALGNFAAVVILVAGLVTASASDLTGGELLFTGFAVWSADVIVFGLWFWEVDAGRSCDSSARSGAHRRDFRFPQRGIEPR